MYLRNKSLGITLNGVAWTPPSIVYIALSTEVFDHNATGSALNEVPSVGDYTRLAVTADGTNFPVVDDGADNGAVFTFPTASADWGIVKSFYIIDAASAGNAFYGADLTLDRTINTGDTGSFPNGAIALLEQ